MNENIIENDNIENHLIVPSPPHNISPVEACNNAAEIALISPPNHMSTPIQLHEFGDPFVSDVKYYNIDEQFDYHNDDELFIGSELSTGKNFRCFSFFNDRHKLSKSARDDLLNLFLTTLPQPNTIKTKGMSNLYLILLPPKGKAVLLR